MSGFNHLEKYEFVNGKDDIPYNEMDKKTCSKPPISIIIPSWSPFRNCAFTRGYIPLNPIKPPFSYGFPMVFPLNPHSTPIHQVSVPWSRLVQGCPPVLFLLLRLAAETADSSSPVTCFFPGDVNKHPVIFGGFHRSKWGENQPNDSWCVQHHIQQSTTWIWVWTWKCWVNLPNEIAIFHRDNDHENHWVQWGTRHFQTHPFHRSEHGDFMGFDY